MKIAQLYPVYECTLYMLQWQTQDKLTRKISSKAFVRSIISKISHVSILSEKTH